MRKFSSLTKVLASTLALFMLGSTLSVCAPSFLTTHVMADDGETRRDLEGTQDVSKDIDFFNTTNIDHSFSYQIRMATNYANRMAAQHVPIGGVSNNYTGDLKFGNVGVFFGYSSGEINTDKTFSSENSRYSINSDSSITYSRDLFQSYATEAGGGVAAYADYGLMLNLMGFDAVGTTSGDNERKLFGTMANAAYYAASSVNSLFQIMFNVLIDANPFQFFKDIQMDSSMGSSALSSISSDAISSTGASKDAMSQLAKYFSDIYNMFNKFAWSVMLPLSLIFLIVSFFLTRRGRMQFGSNIKKFFVRVVFLAIGIPILGSAYTQVLSSLKDSQAMSDEFITQSVSYTFMDFGKWVEQRRLSPVMDMSIQTRKGTGSSSNPAVDGTIPATTWLQLRQMCNDINVKNGVFVFNEKYLGVNGRTGALLKDFIYDTSETEPTLSTTATGLGSVDFDNRQSVSTLIGKYMNSETYSASTFESGTISYLKKEVPNYGDMLTLSCHKYSFSQNASRPIEGIQSKDCTYYNDGSATTKKYSIVAGERFKDGFSDWSGVNLWANNNMSFKQFDAGGGASGAAIYGTTFTGGGSNDSNADTAYGLNPVNKIGLSTMSMYTYLTSSFSQTGITVYGDAPSVFTQNEHYSVNLIGSNYIMRFAFFANMMAILLGYFVLAVFFMIRTVFEVLFKGFELMAQALLASFGFYTSIGRVICLVVNMVAQLLVSVIFFSFMVDLMFIMTSLFDNVLYKVFKLLGIEISGAVTIGGSFIAEVITITSSILSTLVIIFFTSFAIRWRSSIMNSINGMIESLVGTLLGVKLAGAASGMGGMMRGALNDTKTFAKMGTMAGLGVKGVDMVGDSFTDIADTARQKLDGAPDTIDDDANVSDIKTAVDGSVDASVGAGFDGGKGKLEGDAEVDKSIAEDALSNGVGDPKDDKSSDIKDKLSDLQKAGETAQTDEADGAFDSMASGLLVGGVLTRKTNAGLSKSSDEQNTATADKTAETKPVVATAKADNDIKANTAKDTKADDKPLANAVESSVTEDEKGPIWSQTNADTGTTTAARMDSERGLVLGIKNADGKTSDVALGADGVSIGSVDDNSNGRVTKINKDGFTSSYTGTDGSTETVSVNRDGLNSGITTTRTDANGSSESTTTDLNGVTKAKTEVAADGSTRTLATNESTGVTTISEKNATTGYTATETIGANGSSVKTESLNGVSTVTNTSADGMVVGQTITKPDASGNNITTGYVRNDDGSITSSVSSGNVKTETVMQSNGSKIETQSVVRDDGSTINTVTNYGNDAKADKITTTVTAANGMTTLHTSVADVASDGSRTVTETYAGGSTVTTANGDKQSISNYDTSGNLVSQAYTQSKSDGSSVTRYVDGNNQQVGTILRDANGNVSVDNPSKSSIVPTVTQSTNAAGATVYTESNANGSFVQTVSDGKNVSHVVSSAFGADTTTSSIDANSGAVTIQSMRASGDSQTVVRSGSGNNVTEVITNAGIAGDVSTITSQNGKIQHVEAISGANTSFVQECGANGSVVTRQVLDNGSTVVKTMQANGDYVQETLNSNGSSSVIESLGGNVVHKNVSLTGLETMAMSSGSATTETVHYSGLSSMNISNAQTGQASRIFQTATGQKFTVTNDGTGTTKTIVELGDGNYSSVKTETDGSVVNVVRNANGSSRIAHIKNGLEQITYTDSSNNIVSAPQGADSFNDAMAGAMSNISGYVQNVVIPTKSNVANPVASASFSGSRKAAGKSFIENLFSGLVTPEDTMTQTVSSQRSPLNFGSGSMSDIPTRKGGSAQNK